MWHQLLSFLLVVSAIGTLADCGSSPRPLRAALADPDSWALILGPLGDRPQARLAAASRFARDARLSTPGDSAILAVDRVPRLPTGARLFASRVQSSSAPVRCGPVSRAPPGLSAPRV